MNKVDYTIGLLERLQGYTVNGNRCLLLEDVEYIIRNCGILNEEDDQNDTAEKSIKDILERRPGKWPEYYDECDAKEYHEWFIKGTNVKLGFDYIDGETDEHCWYRIISESYDDMIPYDDEEQFIQDIDWMLNNKNLTWRYYQ